MVTFSQPAAAMNHLNYRRGSDPEKAITKESSISVEYAVNAASRENAVHADELVAGNGWSAKLQRFAGRYGVEQRGIERVPSDERPDTNLSRIGSLVREDEILDNIELDHDH